MQENNGVKSLMIDENGNGLLRFNPSSKILKTYNYSGANNENFIDEYESEAIKTAQKFLSQWSSMAVREISSANGICADYNAYLPIVSADSINYYDKNGRIHFLMRSKITITKDLNKKFSDDFAQVGFDKFTGEKAENLLKLRIKKLRQKLDENCLK